MNIAGIAPKQAVCSVFFGIIYSGDYIYLDGSDFDDEDPDDVRTDFANAIEEALGLLGVTSNAENCGEAGDIVLEHMPALKRYFEETTDR